MPRVTPCHSHRRLNPLTGDWVLVSPHRSQRPWQGRAEASGGGPQPAYDPGCYLCAGNLRANGERNPRYTGTFVFTNDFAALMSESGPLPAPPHPLLRADPVRGTCRVVCFSPRHDLSLARMELAGVRQVIETWAEQDAELGRAWAWVQIFENKGEIMGCSNPHPHGQIWASDTLPSEILKEDRRQRRYLEENGVPLLLDYAALEQTRGERVVEENADWLVVVPYWACWPFESLLLPKRLVARLPDLSRTEQESLASILHQLCARYDNLFQVPFPYSMGWHGAPHTEGPHGHWQLHAHFLPPLLRSATIKKYMVGYEMLAEPQRDLTPEQAAQQMRETAPTPPASSRP